jgi:hypothetical protein
MPLEGVGKRTAPVCRLACRTANSRLWITCAEPVGKLLASWGQWCGPPSAEGPHTLASLRKLNPPGVDDKKFGDFLAKFSTGANPQEQALSLWKTRHSDWDRPVEKLATACASPRVAKSGPRVHNVTVSTSGPAPPRVPAGYHSDVCSTTEGFTDSERTPEPLARILAALDGLERDLQANPGSTKSVARVADIWAVMSEVDPDLARLVGQYLEPRSAEGEPS